MNTAAQPIPAREHSPLPATRAQRIAMLAVVLAVTFLAYLETLKFEFVCDDLPQIVYNPVLRSWRNLPQLFGAHLWSMQAGAVPSYYRPVFVAWTLIHYQLFGPNPVAWHLSGVLLHLMTTALVFALARRLLADDIAATIAALLFGLHPIHVETVAWVLDANDTTMAILCLASFLAYLRFLERTARRWLWFALSLFLYGVACLVKEPSIVLPGVIAACEWMLPPPGAIRDKLRRIAAVLTPYAVVAVAYLAVRWSVLRGIGHAALLPASAVLLSWPRLLWFYFQKLVWPTRLSLFYGTPYVLHPGWQDFWQPLLLVIVTVTGVALAIRRLPAIPDQRLLTTRSTAWLAVIWFTLTLLPAFDVASLQPDELAHDRYLYLPSIGFVLLAAIAIRRIRVGNVRVFGVPAAQAACVLVIAAAMAVGVVQQSVYWANDLLLYYRAVKISPNSASALNGLGDALLARNYLDEGIRVHEQIVRRNPYLWHSRVQLGNAYYRQGRYRESEQQLLEAARLSPGVPQLWMYLAVAQMKNEHYADAEQNLRAAIAAQPATGEYYLLGLVLEQQGRWPEAAAAFEQELAIDPNQPKVRAELDAARSHIR